MKIGKYFTKKEFEHSNTAVAKGISNEMNAEQLENAKFIVAKICDPLREWLGKPLKLNSGFRSLALNKAIGGSATSQHMKGEAVDLPINADAFHYIKDNLQFDQLIWEFGTKEQPQWVHVSIRRDGKNRKQVLKAEKKNGKTVYSKF